MSQEEILKYIKKANKPITSREIIDALKLSDGSVMVALRKLTKSKFLTREFRQKKPPVYEYTIKS